MNKFLKRVYISLSRRLLWLIDGIIDWRICGRSLVKYVPSVYRDDAKGVGMTGSHSTSYLILKRIFSHVNLTAEDSFLDVGCGKGRVLAYLLKEHAPCTLSGIEINEISGRVAEEWVTKYTQVSVMIGDAFKLDYNPYTVLFLGRPFLPITFMEFLERLEGTLSHPITFIYWVDQQSGHLLADRPGWEMHYRETLNKIYGIKIAKVPQSYSIWTYDPRKRTEKQTKE